MLLVESSMACLAIEDLTLSAEMTAAMMDMKEQGGMDDGGAVKRKRVGELHGNVKKSHE